MLERTARRPLAPGEPHHDQCPQLTLGGARFAVPPAGRMVTFRPDDDGFAMQVPDKSPWPEERAFRAALPTLRPRRCRRCGHITGGRVRGRDVAGNPRLLSAGAALAARLVRCKYDLSDDQIAPLLAFPAGRAPQWLVQLIRWLAGEDGRQ